MREYKFRGKVKYGPHSGEWGEVVMGSDAIQYGQGNVYFNNTAIDSDTIGQYTGLKDKNGKEIYEGDIVTGAFCTGMVEYWDKGWGGYVVTSDGDDWDGMLADFDDIEVIGNIHENPEVTP